MEFNLQKYQAFLKTVEYGSFTKAAEFLNYSQSGISRMISDIEREWNLTLLERGKAGVWLTSEGEKLLPFIQSLCRECDALKEQVDELSGLHTGLIRIATFSSIATHWIPNIIKHFQADYPGIDYELLMGNYEEIEEWVASGKADCGFLPLPISTPLETIHLEMDELLVALPKDHPLADCEKFPLQALTSDPFILAKTGKRVDSEQIFKNHRLMPNIRCSTFDDYAIMAMVESGLGISILPSLILKRSPYDIVTKSLEVPSYRNLALILRSQKNASLAVKRFLEYLDYRK